MLNVGKLSGRASLFNILNNNKAAEAALRHHNIDVHYHAVNEGYIKSNAVVAFGDEEVMFFVAVPHAAALKEAEILKVCKEGITHSKPDRQSSFSPHRAHKLIHRHCFVLPSSFVSIL